MESALIGLIGVLIGALLSQYFKRENRIEFYSQQVFEKRLEIHEGLFKLLQEGQSIASEVMEDSNLTYKERNDRISDAIMPICYYCDEHAFYLDKYLTAQACAVFMGAEDVLSFEDSSERNKEKKKISDGYLKTREMIIEESGISEVSKHFRIVSKSNLDSPVIRYIKELEKKQEARQDTSTS